MMILLEIGNRVMEMVDKNKPWIIDRVRPNLNDSLLVDLLFLLCASFNFYFCMSY